MRPLTLLLLLAACTGKSEDTEPTAPSPAPAAPAATAPAPVPAPAPAPLPPAPAPAPEPDRKTEDPKLARKQALEAARNAGILGSAALQQGGAFASLTGTGDISSGFDDKEIYGGLLGDEAGEMKGGFGYGRSGFGPGGGGTGWGSIGTGRYGTIGHGSGTGSGYGSGGGRLGGGRGSAAGPTVHIGNAAATGQLDKNIIRRYVRRYLLQIKYCYERQLLDSPTLQGTVVASFVIAENGQVSSASASGLHRDVDSCIADVIRRIQFPTPTSGKVNVRYPFTFRPGDPPSGDSADPKAP